MNDKKEINTLLHQEKQNADQILHASWVTTPLSEMLIIADENYLYLLEFISRKDLEKEITKLQTKFSAHIVEGETRISKQITAELDAYFKGELTAFKTPFKLLGTSFQQQVWQALCTIPYGETISYKTLADKVGNPTGFRAVANANGKNQLAIIVPCHRVINHNGKLGGYGGGLDKKEKLLQLESRV